MEPEFGAEVCNRSVAQVFVFRAEPCVVERGFRLKPSHDAVVLLEKAFVVCESDESCGIYFSQQLDGIVSDEVPEVCIYRSEEGAGFAVPAPAEVVGEVG